jgi:hypothetical protein
VAVAVPGDDGSQCERDNYRVVELARDGEEVGDQVEGEREVANEREKHSLVPAGDARVACDPADETPRRYGFGRDGD